MNKPEVKFGEWIEKGFNLYKANIGLLILASLIAMLLSVVTMGILSGPMFAGLLLIIFRLMDGTEPKPEVGDVFKGFSLFLPTFLFLLVWGAIIMVGYIVLSFIPCLGTLVALLGMIVLEALLGFGLFLIVDRKMDFWSASMESINVVKMNFFPLLGLILVAGLIGSLGSLACGIGTFVTTPIGLCILAVAYREIFSGGVIEAEAVETEPAAPTVDEPAAPAPESPEAPSAPEEPQA